jgi:hypothetical protein
MTDQEKKIIGVRKYFLSLQDKLTKYKTSGQSPPEYLLKHFEDAKRTLRNLSEAPE